MTTGSKPQLLAWPEEPIRVSAPTRKYLWEIRLLILAGLIFMFRFYVWLFRGDQQGESALFWLLIVALSFKSAQWLYEWLLYARIHVTPHKPARPGWSVDVFTTYCSNEPHDMIYRTLKAMTLIRYPHRNYLCDETEDPFIKEFCAELGVVRLTRKDRRTDGIAGKGGKAGNINEAGLSQTSGGICVILDADHEPAPYFLDRVLGYFDDPGIGFVQTVQSYYNQHENLIARGAAEQTYQFYGPVMLGLDGYGTVQTIGANCVFRRSALDSIGGHKDGTTEDRHTSMYLHSKGWRSVYVPEILTRGVVPTTLGAYYKQQLKWSCGCFLLLFRVYPRLFRRLTWMQRIYYGISPLYFLFGVIGVIDLIIISASLVLGYIPVEVSLQTFVAMYLPLLLLALVIRQASQRYLIEPEKEGGFHVIGGLLRIGTWWIFILGFVYAALGRHVPYLTTSKLRELKNEWGMAVPNFIGVLIAVLAVIFGLSYDSNPYSLLMAGLACFIALALCYNVALGAQLLLSRLAYAAKRMSTGTDKQN